MDKAIKLFAAIGIAAGMIATVLQQYQIFVTRELDLDYLDPGNKEQDNVSNQ